MNALTAALYLKYLKGFTVERLDIFTAVREDPNIYYSNGFQVFVSPIAKAAIDAI